MLSARAADNRSEDNTLREAAVIFTDRCGGRGIVLNAPAEASTFREVKLKRYSPILSKNRLRVPAYLFIFLFRFSEGFAELLLYPHF